MPNPNLPINFRKNTYIGARYVPKFSDTPGSEWDNSIQYEPLTIVLYQGNSYTSKTFVPVGVDINNATYWAETGNYNAQVEGYRQDVIKYQQYVESISSGSYYKLDTKQITFTNLNGMSATVYITTVPKNYGIKIGVAPSGELWNPAESAYNLNASFTSNAGVFDMTTDIPRGNIIIDGVIKYSGLWASGESTPSQVLAIDENGNLSAINAENLNGSELLSRGITNCVQGWYSIMINGESTLKGSDSALGRSGIGQKNGGDYVFLTCPLNQLSAGLGCTDMIKIFKNEGCDFAYNLDGGGSAAQTNNNFTVNLPSNDLKYRPVPSFLYVPAKIQDFPAPIDIYTSALQDQKNKENFINTREFYKPSIRILNPNNSDGGLEIYNAYSPNAEKVRTAKYGCDGRMAYIYHRDPDGEKTVFSASRSGISDAFGLIGKFYASPKFLAKEKYANAVTGIYEVNASDFPNVENDYYIALWLRIGQGTSKGVLCGASHTYGFCVSVEGEITTWNLKASV